MGFIVGVRFETGLLGVLIFIFMAGLWGLAFTGFPYAIALKTGNPAAVNTSFILFFPFAFLTTSFLPLRRSAAGSDGRRLEPGDVPAGGHALADCTAGGTSTTSESGSWRSPSSAR